MKIKKAKDITCFVVVRLCNKFKNAPILPGSCCVTHFVFSRRFRIFGTTNNAPQKFRQNMISHCLRQGWEQRQKQNVAFHAFWSQFISCIWCYWHLWANVEFEVWECGLLFFCQRKQALEGNSLISSPSECFSLPNPEISNPIAFSISLYTPFVNSLEVKDHECQLGEVFPRYASREFVGKTGNQISQDQKSDFNKSKFRTRHWCHMCCGLPAGGIPWIALAAFLLDPEARQTDSKKLAHRLISCIRSPASAACNSSWGRKKSGHRSKDASMPVQQNCGKNPVSLLRVKTFEAKAAVQSTRWEDTRQNLWQLCCLLQPINFQLAKMQSSSESF